MVCIRCQMVVKAELEKLGISYVDVKIGEVNTIEDIPEINWNLLDIALKKAGLELDGRQKKHPGGEN